jgi:hypothetical protein
MPQYYRRPAAFTIGERLGSNVGAVRVALEAHSRASVLMQIIEHGAIAATHVEYPTRWADSVDPAGDSTAQGTEEPVSAA